MPVFYQQTIDKHTKIGIWKIEEPEQFFLQTVPLESEITHWHKRLQHLAGRYMLRYLFPDFPFELIRIADTRRPFLENDSYHFSISHCGDFAAAIVSKDMRVGLDIELYSDKIERVKNKFISADEFNLLEIKFDKNDLLRYYTLMWSSKESIFKWYGKGKVDFRQHIQLRQIENDPSNDILLSKFIFSREEDQMLEVSSVLLEKFSVSWIGTL